MKNKQNPNIYKDILICLGIATLVLFIFRLWFICFLFIIAMVINVIIMLFRKLRKQDSKSDIPASNIQKIETETRINTAYERILVQITDVVRNKYPGAKWVWAQPNTERMIENGEDIAIFLNQSGGYRRAKIKIMDNQVLEIEFLTSPAEVNKNEQKDSFDTSNKNTVAESQENYELLAYEWVEAHILELNERCNEAIAKGEEILIAATALPVRESWPSICEELKRAGLDDVICLPDGIKIKFT